MIEARPMNAEDAKRLGAAMAAEKPDYLVYFTAFRDPDALYEQCQETHQDAFFTLIDDDKTVGFFCLRGLDAGFLRPSFGVYIASSMQGRGAARFALKAAQSWCKERGIAVMMLKVAPQNTRALAIYELDGFKAAGKCPDSGQTIMEKVIV